MAMKSGDTAHLYDGKTVRSAAPSRKKLAGTASSTGEIPKDAIPTVEIPTFISEGETHYDRSSRYCTTNIERQIIIRAFVRIAKIVSIE